MKPLELKLKGIHSFKESQTVDFEELTEAGLFGIFGPTGAGKSTILDAITLALYGKVERAPANKEGILNHASDEMFASFQFTLGNGMRKRIYKAERSFKLQKNGSVKQTVSRLIENSDSPVTLADKASDMDKAIVKLLGLELDDFTRAVVLPQGKFSEFLTLKGTERRKMLQRLFHLEKYGDQLNANLKHKLDDTAKHLAVITSEQAGLGNASKSMISEQRKMLAELQNKQISTKQQFTDMSKQMKKVERWDELSEKLEDVKIELNHFEQVASNLANEEDRLSKAETALNGAERARSVLELKQDIQALKQRTKTQSEQKETTQKKLFDARETFKTADHQLQHEKNDLKQQADGAEQAIRLIEEKKKMTADLEQLQEQQKNLHDALEKINNKRTRHQSDLKRYEKEVGKLKMDLENHLLSEDEEHLIAGTGTILDQKKELSSRVENTDNAIEKIRGKQNSLRNEQIRIEKNADACKNKLLQQYDQILYWYNALSSYKRSLETAKKMIKQNLSRRQENIHATVLAEIREQLQPEEACPLCGSVYHERHRIEVHDTENDLPSLDAFSEEVETLLKEVDKQRFKLESAAEKLPFTPETASQEKMTEIKAPALDDAEFEKDLKRLSHTLHVSVQTITKLIEDADQTIPVYRQYQDELIKIGERLSGLDDQREQLLIERNRAEDKLTEIADEWRNKTRLIPFNQAESAIGVLKERKENYHNILSRLQNARPAIEDKITLINDANDQMNQMQVDQAALETKISFQKEQLQSIENTIHSLTKGERPEDIKKSVSERIQLLDETFKKASENLKTIEKVFQDNSNELIRLESSLESKISFLQEQEKSLMNWLDNTPFRDEHDVLQHTISKTELEKQKQVLHEKKEAHRHCQEKHRTIKKEMDEIQLTESERDTIRLETENLQKKIEALSDQIGRKGQEIESLVTRAERYEVLEKERIAVVSLLEDLEKLQVVFRGKQFVEFIAEEQLIQVSRLASERLYELTKGKFAIEIDSNGGFLIRDDANGGIKRPVSSLSGGETFITSLALALALSMTIQLKGEHPLEFFFLDEGFGTLDEHLLETVISALEGLQTSDLSVGIISHVKELRERIPRKLIVSAPNPGGAGSKVSIEHL